VDLFEALRSAFRTLRNQRLRTVLTLFGLVWGTASVIFLMSWGAGTRQMVESGYTKVGKNLVQIWAGRIGEDFTPAVDRRHLWFTRQQVETLRQRAGLADRVAGEVSGMYISSFGQKSLNTNVRGIEPVTLEMRGVSLAAGRAINERDVEARRRVALIGAKMRRDLLGPSGRIGSRIRIHGRSYEVVGFLDEVGTQFWQDGGFPIDEQIWIPITTLLSITPDYGTGDEILSSILLRLRDRTHFDALRIEIREVLAPVLGVSPTDKEAVLIGSPIEALRKLPLNGMKFVMFILGVTTLGIGGIGILSMMLDAVQERRQEIGVRLAVGARRRDILLQFFLETFVIAVVGGVTGVGLGIGCCRLMQAAAVPGRIPAPILTAEVVAAAVISMVTVAIVSGTVPAWRASQVEPSLTLRAD
jgi:putative ABC transport system permease protein